MTFGQALTIAQYASQSDFGVRPAFLLAILTQESGLGKNVGTCNCPGESPSKSYKVIMKPDRDIQPFLQITAALGRDPDVTPVSCPLHDASGNQEGWGGAMDGTVYPIDLGGLRAESRSRDRQTGRPVGHS